MTRNIQTRLVDLKNLESKDDRTTVSPIAEMAKTDINLIGPLARRTGGTITVAAPARDPRRIAGAVMPGCLRMESASTTIRT